MTEPTAVYGTRELFRITEPKPTTRYPGITQIIVSANLRVEVDTDKREAIGPVHFDAIRLTISGTTEDGEDARPLVAVLGDDRDAELLSTAIGRVRRIWSDAATEPAR